MKGAKRAFDIVASVCALACIAPFAPFIAAAIAIESGFPVIVALRRVSGGKVVRVYKFRSMVRGAETKKDALRDLNERDGPFFKMAHDPRVTKIGKILRKLRIDEFPQFINVLKGELSVVGPRPHEPEEVMHYPKEFAHIPFAQAGVTGLSQISGASSLLYREELVLDARYLEHVSLWSDIKILVKTVLVFFTDPTGI